MAAKSLTSLLLVAAMAVAQDLAPVARCANGQCNFLTKNANAEATQFAPGANAPAAPQPQPQGQGQELSSQREPVKNSFADCHAPCGGPGLCPTFCGQGNACCRKSGDITVPNECKGVHNFWTPHYECIAPVRPAFDEFELGAGPDEASAAQPAEDPHLLTYAIFGAGSCFMAGVLALYHVAGEANRHDEAALLRSVSSAVEKEEQPAVFDRKTVTPATPEYMPVEPTAGGFLSAPAGTLSKGPTLLQSGNMNMKPGMKAEA